MEDEASKRTLPVRDRCIIQSLTQSINFYALSSMRPLVVCCDGTWQSLTTSYPTNVSKIAQGICPNEAQPIPVIYYHGGIGTEDNPGDRYLGGGFGRGLDAHIQLAYEFLCFNFIPGDEIYLSGREAPVIRRGHRHYQ